ncbi:MAG TPA: hypothetical protein VK994_01730 [Bacteroidales bacterium]|nr:hypothetical protein [Bacteroidales bacterium]
MPRKQLIIIEEPFLQQEIVLGMCIGIGILMLVVSETLGEIIVLVSLVTLFGIYVYRFIHALKEGEEGLVCCFSWTNNGAMLLAVAGILTLMLTNAFHRPVFYSSIGIVLVGLAANGIFLHYNFRGMTHITAQVRLIIAMVVMVVFFLL